MSKPIHKVGGMSLSRPTSAPPTKLENATFQDVAYATFFRKKSRTDSRLPLPNFVEDGQGSLLYFSGFDSESSFLSKMYDPEPLTPKSLVERIDEDFPDSETSECVGGSRCTTPVGCAALNLLLSDILQFLKKSGKEPLYAISEFCCTQEGSRFVQHRLETSTEGERQWLLAALRPDFNRLCLDVFGNYVVQKLIVTNYREILVLVENNLKALCLDTYGCRVVQRLMEFVSINVNELKNSIVELVLNQNGNHVVQKLIELGEIGMVVEEFKQHVILLCKNKYGCRAIQRVLNFNACDEDDEIENNEETKQDSLKQNVLNNSSKREQVLSMSQSIKFENPLKQNVLNNSSKREQVLSMYQSTKFENSLISKLQNLSLNSDSVLLSINEIYISIMTNLKDLITDQYGNYVIQHIIVNGNKKSIKIIFDVIIKDFYNYSVHKFGSNVVEKVILYCREAERKKVVNSLVEIRGDRSLAVWLSTNSFGNYVVQRFVECCDVADRCVIRDVCKEFVLEMKRCVYAKQIVTKLF